MQTQVLACWQNWCKAAEFNSASIAVNILGGNCIKFKKNSLIHRLQQENFAKTQVIFPYIKVDLAPQVHILEKPKYLIQPHLDVL